MYWERTLYNRLRLRHIYLTHSYLLKDEDTAVCIPCNSLLIAEHTPLNPNQPTFMILLEHVV